MNEEPHGLFPTAHLPLLAVGIHGEVTQAFKLELIKGTGREDGAVNQGIGDHTQGVLARGSSSVDSSASSTAPLLPGTQQEGVGGTEKWVPQVWVQKGPRSCCYSQG